MTIISKSDFLKFKICPRLLWNYKYRRKYMADINEDIFELGRHVEKHAQNAYERATLEPEIDRDTKNEQNSLKSSVFSEYKNTSEENLQNYYLQKYAEAYRIGTTQNLSERVRKTKEIIESSKNIEHVVNIYEAAFQYENLYVQVDILQINPDSTLTIIENKATTNPTNSQDSAILYFRDLYFQVYVIENAGYNIKKSVLSCVNSNYERIGALNLNQLFKEIDLTDYLNDKNHHYEVIKLSNGNYELTRTMAKTTTKTLLFTEDENGNIIDFKMIEKLLNGDNPDYISVHEGCVKPYDCPFKQFCHQNLFNDKQSIFALRGSNFRINQKLQAYNDGIKNFNDLINSSIELSPTTEKQIRAELHNIQYWDNEQILIELYKLKNHDLYHLDFESYQQAIPEWDFVSPYEQIPFQYSLHIQRWNEKSQKHEIHAKHYEFLGDGQNDPRRALAEKLCQDIPKNALVVAYNIPFEQMVLKRLAFLYPDLKDHLLSLVIPMFDVLPIYRKMWDYNAKMVGSYSIKKVLPATIGDDPELDYKQLQNIQNGSDAMSVYPKLPTYNNELKAQLRKDLLAYCRLDTLAMVHLINYLEAKVVDKGIDYNCMIEQYNDQLKKHLNKKDLIHDLQVIDENHILKAFIKSKQIAENKKIIETFKKYKLKRVENEKNKLISV